ncbi:BspA family leucine-rich repeat surface protein [Leuconostoc pseudomesenteroides]|uniref:BspA family leucine-rich repeat surface protein n=1 Tax=Leuconostoc pseudomesenteroides TaxID=33968 RepID=A0ABT6HC29_LEUPS|nr:BspA family leucine-rich repeat surface protein [Leuconostoc pseudomesenteroides]MDG9732718.1 BspA family leucine-rich repeat surface protein [Leuconostoc pseudomesenteroides]NKZ35519.1 BspA family leucine-rich repeat surface protein [Leuconostoc pseudomesenteroides]QQB27956.1 BspA family leucine-rich repeat surface protein [Leuconostoc pseudomesenteroides]
MRLNKQFYLQILIALLTFTGPVQAVTAAEVMTADNVKTDKKLCLPNAGRSDLQELIQRVATDDTGDGQPTEPEPDEPETPEVAQVEQPKVEADPQVEEPLAKTDSKPASSGKAPRAITTNTNGTSTWTFDSDTGLLVFGAGQLAQRIDQNLVAADLVATQVKKIQFEANVTVDPNVTYLFANLGQLSEFIDLQNFDTSNVTSMAYWFYYTKGLTNPDLSVLNTSNVTNMSYMFYGSGVTSLDLSGWSVDKVVYFSYMFYGTDNLEYLNLSDWGNNRTATSVRMAFMFSDTTKLTTLIMKNFQTTNVTNMSGMFSNTGLTSLNLSDWDVRQVVTFEAMFSSEKNLSTLNLSNWGVNRTATSVSMRGMFQGSSNNGLTKLNLTNFQTTNVTNMSDMFYQNETTETIDLSSWNVDQVTTFQYMFAYSNIKSLDLSNWGINRTANGVDMSYMFYSKVALISLNLTNFKTTNVTNMSNMFAYSNIEELDFSGWNVTKVTTFLRMFYSAKIQSLNLSDWHVGAETSSVIMAYMFYSTPALTSLDLTNSTITNVTTMFYMFTYTGLTSLNLSNCDVSKVTTFQYMFYKASNLLTLNLSGWGNSRSANNVDMSYMFADATVLSSLTLTGFNTSNVTNMSYMFSNTKLASLDLSNWDVTKVTNFTYMFSNSKLMTLDLTGWSTTSGNAFNIMFNATNSLWKIALGKNIKFANNPNFTSAPAVGTTITDNGQKYKTTAASWQEVGTGTDHCPTGNMVTTTQMYADRSEPVTYVWAQTPTIDAASNIVFGTLNASVFGGGKLPIATNMSTGKLDLINLEATITYDITVSQTSDWEANGTTDKITRHDLKLMYGDDELSDHATTFWQGQSENSQKSVSLSHNPDKSFRLSLNPATIIKSSLLDKQMQSTLTWSFNDTPS